MTRYLDPANFWNEAQRRRQPWEMNVYDLLRKLSTGGQWSQEERDGAVTLVNLLEELGVFGSTAATIETKGEG